MSKSKPTIREIVHPDEVQPWFTGYRYELEPREEILQQSIVPYANWRALFESYEWEPPDEIDARSWYDIHNQGSVGSCQGQSLADAGEFLHVIAHGEEIQLSRGFAYLASQEFDGLLGRDSGSTLSGGTKAAARGIPLESEFDYVASYSRLYSDYRSKKSDLLAGKLWKFPGAIAMPDEESAWRFSSSWSGVIQIGIRWSLGDGWEHTTYRPGGGGHAVLLAGYLKRNGWPNNRGWLLKNSWSESWGEKGWGLIHPNVVNSWCKSQTVIGRSDMKAPAPRIEAKDNWRTVA